MKIAKCHLSIWNLSLMIKIFEPIISCHLSLPWTQFYTKLNIFSHSSHQHMMLNFFLLLVKQFKFLFQTFLKFSFLLFVLRHCEWKTITRFSFFFWLKICLINQLFGRRINIILRFAKLILWLCSDKKLIFVCCWIRWFDVMKDCYNFFSRYCPLTIQIIQIKDKFLSFGLCSFASEWDPFQKLLKSAFILMESNKLIPKTFV